jgi:hypothetical protein
MIDYLLSTLHFIDIIENESEDEIEEIIGDYNSKIFS